MKEKAFKVGDWVKQVKENYSDFPRYFKIKYVTDKMYGVENNIYDIDAIQNTNNQFELWIPKEGDWVIPDTGIDKDMFVVMRCNGLSLIPNRCRPFIGELPYEN